ncbi:MAG: S9 family peptidase [Phycisphaerales bacterium]|nr:S9 family peptidase [Phycisphaerales bacterium]
MTQHMPSTNEEESGPMLFETMMLTAIAATADEAAAPVPTANLIPREVLFGNPERSSVQISPDGTMLSFRAPVDGVMNAWVQPLDGGDARSLTTYTDRPIGSLHWAWNGEQLLFTKDKGGDENYHVFSVDIDDAKIRDLTPVDGARASIADTSRDRPDEVIVNMNDVNPQFMNVYRVNTRTGERTLVQENDGYLGFTLDDDWNVRGRASMDDDGALIMEMRDLNGKEWYHFMTIPSDEMMTTNVSGFSKDGTKLYGASSLGRDKAALVWWEPRQGGAESPHVVFESDKADVSGGIVNPDTYEPEAITVNYLKPEWHILDEVIAKDIEALKKLDQGDFGIASRTKDNSKWIVAYNRDNGPPRYWLWDRPNQQGTFLFTTWPALEGAALTSMKGVEIPTRDGLTMPSYLTVPEGSDGKNLPMVLFVHGGPWARDYWGYNPYHQWLADRGYAVLSPNFRGSTGFGKNFVNAGNREWYGKMQDDLNDAVAWAVEQGIADPKRVAIMGGSYGGYATLAGLTRDPELFACGVDIVGPSHVGTLIESAPPYWKPIMKMFDTRVGSMDEPAYIDAISPLTHVEYINKPLLIGQGANDPRVKIAESDQIVEAMNKRGLPVTYVVFPDEGHGFHNPKNNMAFNAVTEEFLAKHIGGNAEPVGNDIADSTAQIRDKGGLALAGTETYVATEGEGEQAPVETITLDQLSPEEQQQVQMVMTQLTQMPIEQLPAVRDQMMQQRAMAPPDAIKLVDYIIGQLDEKIEQSTKEAG